MPERMTRVVKAIQRLFEDLGVDVVNERIIQFVVQEIHNGKTLKEALNEPYVLNNTNKQWRREVLEKPQIIRAVNEQLAKAFGAPGGGGKTK